MIKQNGSTQGVGKPIFLAATSKPWQATQEAYERAERQATALLEQGFHLGGAIRATRDEWHER